MTLDLNITLQILQILSILGGGFFFLARMEKKLAIVYTIQDTFTKRLERIDAELDKLTNVTVDMARQHERMTSFDMRLTTISVRLDDLAKQSHSVRRSKG